MWRAGSPLPPPLFPLCRVLLPVLLLPLLLPCSVVGVILTGSATSFARFPKWAQTFENQLSLEFRTRSASALLMYTDDGGVQGNFYALTIVDGRLQLDFRLGDSSQDVLMDRPVHSIRVEQVKVDDGRWHKFILFQAWENVKVQLDDTVVFKILTQRSFAFGNLRSNSDVFIGGVPTDIQQLGQMSSPLRRHTKRFAGAIKNLVYRLYPQGVSSPQMISSKGTRQTDDDYCALESPCKNGARCFSTNDGAACDCAFTDFEGAVCDRARPGPALSFFGHEWIGYDVTNHTAALVQNRYENISIQFRTDHPNGLLFAAGDKSSYVQLVIERGVLIAASKLFGTDKRIIRMFNKANQPARFDDGQWHQVVLFRDVQLMRLTVDGQTDEVKQFSGDTEWLGNSFAYVGGALPHRPYIPGFTQPFRGCMKRIRYEADAQLLDVIELADQGFGQSVIRTGGDLSFACDQGSAAPTPDVLSFNSGLHTVALPKWNSPSGGSLGFQFRTGEPDALILYHGLRRTVNETHGDYVAFEIIDGHLFLVLNLGSGVVRLQATAQRVDDPRVWHSVQLERLGRGGSVVVDHLKTDFSTPGVSANLQIDEPIFLGGMPWKEFQVPVDVWSAHLHAGFIGCIKNVRINGIHAQIAKLFAEQAANKSMKNEVSVGCPSLSGSDYCAAEPCMNGATCRNGHTTFYCDCAKTHFEGTRCNDEPAVYSFARRHGDAPRIRLPHQKLSQAENVEIKFRTEDNRAILLDSGSWNHTDRFRLTLDRGRLQLRLSFSGSRHAFGWGEALNDNQWHTVRVQRRGDRLRLFVDGKWENHYTLPDGIVNLHLNELSVAEPLRSYDGDSEESTENDDLDGDLIRATFNELDLLEEVRLRQKDRASSEERTEGSQRLKHRKVKSSTVWFDSADGHLVFSVFENVTRHGLKLSFKFRTLSTHAMLALLWNERPTETDVAAVQLVDGMLRLTRISRAQLSTATIKGKRWNDLRWHTVQVTEGVDGGLRVAVENRSAETSPAIPVFRNGSRLYVGGLPNDLAWPSGVTPTGGFRGCLASLKLGSEPLDLWSDAESGVQVEKGCRAPSNRCHADTCKNRGLCRQSWTAVNCDCSQTPFAGDSCEQLGTTFEFDGDGSCVYYEFPANQRPSTAEDTVVLAFQTEQSNGVLLSVQCGVDGDFLALFLAGGQLQVRFSLGSQVHHVQLTEKTLHDSRWHVVRMQRKAANLTLQLDEAMPVRYSPKDGLATLNTQWRVVVGAAFNSLHSVPGRRRRHTRVFDEFRGKIAGVNFNGLRVLDAFAHGSEHSFATGRPRLVHMAATDVLIDTGLFTRIEPLGDGFFAANALDCISNEERVNCGFDEVTTGDEASSGFFTPVVPAVIAPPVTTTTRRPRPPPSTAAKTTVTAARARSTTTTSSTSTTTTTASTTASPGRRSTPATPECPPVRESPSPTVPVRIADAGPHLLDSLWVEVGTRPPKVVTTTPPTTTTTRSTSTSTTTATTTTTTTTAMALMPPEDSEEEGDDSGLPRGDAIDRPITLHMHDATPLYHAMPVTEPTLFAVRPTTPMGLPAAATTMLAILEPAGDYPRTLMILIGSILLVFIITVILVGVFWCCRGGALGPYGSECKAPPGAVAAGYAPIPSEGSPPEARVCANGNGLHPGGALNGTGTLKRPVMENSSAAPLLPPPEKRKDFKEWYV